MDELPLIVWLRGDSGGYYRAKYLGSQPIASWLARWDDFRTSMGCLDAVELLEEARVLLNA